MNKQTYKLTFLPLFEKVGRFKYQGLILGKYKEEINTEFKDKEEGNA